MTASLREAATMALEALEMENCPVIQADAADALRAALAEPDAEPATGLASSDGSAMIGWVPGDITRPSDKLYAAPRPAPVERQPLTALQANALPVWNGFIGLCFEQRERIVRGVEAAHNIKAAP